MADDIDFANDLMDSEVSRALSKLRQQAPVAGMEVKSCIECGDDMPVERQKLGFKLCVPCASETERRKSMFADY
jgi:hypothetical protein